MGRMIISWLKKKYIYDTWSSIGESDYKRWLIWITGITNTGERTLSNINGRSHRIVTQDQTVNKIELGKKHRCFTPINREKYRCFIQVSRRYIHLIFVIYLIKRVLNYYIIIHVYKIVECIIICYSLGFY